MESAPILRWLIFAFQNVEGGGADSQIRNDTPLFGGDNYPAWKKQFTPRVPPLAPVIIPHIVRHRDMPVARRDANESFILFGSQHRVNGPAGDKVFHFP